MFGGGSDDLAGTSCQGCSRIDGVGVASLTLLIVLGWGCVAWSFHGGAARGLVGFTRENRGGRTAVGWKDPGFWGSPIG